MSDEGKPKADRREFLRRCLGGAAGLTVAGVAGGAAVRAQGDDYVWQIDPYKCVQCGLCATECVLKPSAVKCVHAYVTRYNDYALPAVTRKNNRCYWVKLRACSLCS